MTQFRRTISLLLGVLGIASTGGRARAQGGVAHSGVWASLGVGAANRGLGVGAASLWFDIRRITLGARMSDAETPLAAAGSRIDKTREAALLVGWRPRLGPLPLSLLLAGGVSEFENTATEGDSRAVVESSNQSGPTVDGELGLRITKHFGLGLSAFAVKGQMSSYVAGTIAIRFGQLPD